MEDKQPVLQILPHEKEIDEYIKTIDRLKKQSSSHPLFNSEIHKLEEKLEALKKKIYASLTPWQRIQICRHPSRPHSLDYIRHICDSFEELCGDRCFGNDRALIGGLASIGGIHCVVIGQEKGCDTETRMAHNFGMMHPEGFRKALRLMELAQKFKLPVLSFIDTPGAQPTLEAEERGQGWAIAQNLRQMSLIETPIIAVIIGEGCSGGALGIGLADVVGMLEHSYYSVISPEGCASILWKDAGEKEKAAAILKLHAEDLLPLQIVDMMIEEPLGGAHHQPDQMYGRVKRFFMDQWNVLRHIPIPILKQQRYGKFRQIGRYLEE